MKLNCLITGVGGQGTILASKMLAQTAILKKEYAQTSETIGMAQRGGSVVSHVRIGDKAASPNIPFHGADMIIGFEPAEAVRNLNLLKPNGTCIVSSKGIRPVTASLSGVNYDPSEMITFLKAHTGNLIVIDGEALCEKLGNSKALNMILLGAALGSGHIPFTKEDLINTLHTYLPERFWAVNERAIEMGMSESLSLTQNIGGACHE